MLKFSARSRWAIPAGSVAAVAVVGIAVAAIAGAQSAPRLPARSPAQLLALIEEHLTKSPGPLTATVQETSNLGLPAFPVPAASASPSIALPASPTLQLWYLNPQHFRVAVPVRAGETDLRFDGRTIWLWNSKTQTAVKSELPKNPGGNGLPPGQSGMSAPGSPGAAIPDPASMARQVLAAVGPSTSVTVAGSVYVAGRAAYQLSVQPRSSQSLVGQVLIAIDAKKYVPLRVQVFARGSSAPVYSIGFTSLTFGPPAASNFSFSPPPGAKVETENIPGGLGPAGLFGGLDPAAFSSFSSLSGESGGASLGSAGKVPPMPAKVLRQMKANFARSLPPGMSKAQRAAAIKEFDQQMAAAKSGNPGIGGGFTGMGTGAPAPGGQGPRDFGQDWLRVVASPTSPKAAAVVRALFSGKPLPAGSLPGGAASDLAALRVLARDATAVHGSWGSGWLLRTPLVSVLVESNGRVLFGAVEPAVLYADAGA